MPVSTRDSSASTGIVTCTGPGRPDAATLYARSINPPSSEGSVAVHDAFVTGSAMRACGISWKAPCPASPTAELPEMSTRGDSAIRAT